MPCLDSKQMCGAGEDPWMGIVRRPPQLVTIRPPPGQKRYMTADQSQRGDRNGGDAPVRFYKSMTIPRHPFSIIRQRLIL